MTRMKILGFVMAGLALVACGGDEGDGDGGSGSDIEGKQLGALTAEEADGLCDDLRGQTNTISKEDECEAEGVVGSLFGIECETTKQECISAAEESELTGELDSCGASQFTGCTATVAELRACMTAVVGTIKALTCESTLADIAQKPAACAAAEEKCPAFFGRQDEEDESEAEGP
ncbi:hypothetical protein [Sorangium atrum]|uniref:Secreted protein n=1 Tax=Sorangium atrum TaxID=2995308 RepID=A0ABT5C3Q9_9BACT|nr:hypothetical protein [Sorangium aterium]MDC0679821.1 hypothetical protein [Sorangium aterium]